MHERLRANQQLNVACRLEWNWAWYQWEVLVHIFLLAGVFVFTLPSYSLLVFERSFNGSRFPLLTDSPIRYKLLDRSIWCLPSFLVSKLPVSTWTAPYDGKALNSKATSPTLHFRSCSWRRKLEVRHIKITGANCCWRHGNRRFPTILLVVGFTDHYSP